MKWITMFILFLFACTLSADVYVNIPDGQSTYFYSDYFALIIGNSDYLHFPRLNSVKQDVQDIQAMFNRLGIPTETKENLSGQQLIHTLNHFVDVNGSKENRGLILYYAGHGFTERNTINEQMSYITGTDAQLYDRDKSNFRQNSVSMNQIKDYAKLIKSKHVLMIFDSFLSGGFFHSGSELIKALDDESGLPVRQFIIAGDAGDEVPDQGLFKNVLIKGFDYGFADRNKDGYVTGEELGYYLSTAVPIFSNYAQHPRYGKIKEPEYDRGDFVFVIKPPIEGPEIVEFEIDDDLSEGQTDLELLAKHEQFLMDFGTPRPAASLFEGDGEMVEFVAYDDAPVIIGELRVVYPESAKRTNTQGTVVLEVEVYRDGRIGNIHVRRSIIGLDQAAIDAVRKVKFQPGKSGGYPVDTMLIIPVDFSLQ